MGSLRALAGSWCRLFHFRFARERQEKFHFVAFVFYKNDKGGLYDSKYHFRFAAPSPAPLPDPSPVLEFSVL